MTGERLNEISYREYKHRRDRSSQNIIANLEEVQRQIDNSIIRISARGVPHVVVDSKYSICYFVCRNVYKIWSGYATPENKKIKTVDFIPEVVEVIEKLRKGEPG